MKHQQNTHTDTHTRGDLNVQCVIFGGIQRTSIDKHKYFQTVCDHRNEFQLFGRVNVINYRVRNVQM